MAGAQRLHTLFAREHNAVCDELVPHYRHWSDERIYQTARLIVAALIAKIHTVEWTPAILGDRGDRPRPERELERPAGHDWLTRLGIWLMDTHASVGIPKTTPDHHGVPYSLTEDFVTVYRMHPLIPDDYRFLDHPTGADRAAGASSTSRAASRCGAAVVRPGQHAVLVRHRPSRRDHAAQLPARRCRTSSRDGEHIDLSVVDLVRTRRRGVPALQRLPGRAAQAAAPRLRGALRRTRSRCAGCASYTAASTRSTR